MKPKMMMARHLAIVLLLLGVLAVACTAGLTEEDVSRIVQEQQAQGEPGPSGERGAKGEQGDPGEPGAKGERGKPGPTKALGPTATAPQPAPTAVAMAEPLSTAVAMAEPPPTTAMAMAATIVPAMPQQMFHREISGQGEAQMRCYLSPEDDAEFFFAHEDQGPFVVYLIAGDERTVSIEIELFRGSGLFADSVVFPPGRYDAPTGPCVIHIGVDQEAGWFLQFPTTADDPSPVPVPTARPVPTTRPVSTARAVPTATPAPSRAFARSPLRGETVESSGYQTFSFSLETGPEEFTMIHSGQGYFAVVIRADFIDGVMVLIEVSGPSESVSTVYVPYDSTGYFEVLTEEDWTIEFPK